MAEMRTTWRCDRCHERGKVVHDEHADVWAVLEMIRADHGTMCRYGLGYVRVLALEEYKSPLS